MARRGYLLNSSLQCIRVVIVLLCLFAVVNAKAQNASQSQP